MAVAKTVELFSSRGLFSGGEGAVIGDQLVEDFSRGHAPVEEVWEIVDSLFHLTEDSESVMLSEISDSLDDWLHLDSLHQKFWNDLNEHGIDYKRIQLVLFVFMVVPISSFMKEDSNFKEIEDILLKFSQSALSLYLRLVRIHGNANIFHAILVSQSFHTLSYLITRIFSFIIRFKLFLKIS